MGRVEEREDVKVEQRLRVGCVDGGIAEGLLSDRSSAIQPPVRVQVSVGS
jgi:hypothetical protein